VEPTWNNWHMTSILKQKLCHLAGRAPIPASLPEAIRLELMGELFLSGRTRTYSPHSNVIEGLEDRYNIHTFPPLPFPGLRHFTLSPSEGRRLSVSDEETGERGLWVHPGALRKPGLKNRALLENRNSDLLDFYSLASHRAVLVQDETGWRRLKLHLWNVKISRYFRNLGGMTIFHSVQVSGELKEKWDVISALYRQGGGGIAPGLYLDERGVVLKNTGAEAATRAGEWGSIERSLTPMGLPPALVPMPLFAFYGENTLPESGDRLQPLAVELCEQAGADPETFLFETLMAPVIRLWSAIFRTTGIIWEPHGQNVVLLCDPDTLMPRGVAFRDPDTALSKTMRDRLGLSSEAFFERNLHGEEFTLEMPEGARSEISRVIDISMGKNTFDYLARLFEKHFGCPPAALQRRCRELFAEWMPDADSWFPRAVHGYATSPLPEDRNCYPLEVRDGVAPVWRPGSARKVR
jgi:hypothetical protein